MLIVGIENGIEKGFTKEEISFTNSFEFGMLHVTAKVGNIIPKGWNAPKDWSYAHYYTRITGTNATLQFFNKLPDFFTLDFVKRMDKAGFTCNVGYEDNDAWLNNIKRIIGDEEE